MILIHYKLGVISWTFSKTLGELVLTSPMYSPISDDIASGDDAPFSVARVVSYGVRMVKA